jgi:RNA polymerase sigma-70 factor (ECF subfamily)
MKLLEEVPGLSFAGDVFSMQLDERQLVKKAKNGDTQAFGELVIKHQVFAYNLALRALGNPDEAQDATQEAFLKVWQALPGFREESQFRTWLYRIVINQCYNRRPMLKREVAAISLEPGDDWISSEFNGPESLAVVSERKALLQKAVDELPSSYRLMVMLRFQQDLAYEEIASVMNLPLGTVKTGLFRARALLRQSLTCKDRVIEWAM